MGGLLALLGKAFTAVKAGGAKLATLNEKAKLLGAGPEQNTGAGGQTPMPLLSPPPQAGVTPETMPSQMPLTPEMLMRLRMMQQQNGRPNFGMTSGGY